MDADVAVIGAGSTGSMALWQLARRGVPVIGFEQFGPGHDRGAAGGETRIFRTAYLEGAEYVPLLQEAYILWRELEQETGRRLLTLTGGLMIGDPQAQFMKNVLESIETFGLDHEILDEKAARSRYPQHRLLAGEVMVLDKMAGFLRPEYAVLTAAQRAEELGAVIHRHTRVQAIEPAVEHVRIRAEGKDYIVGKVVISAGPWTGKLLPGWEQWLRVQRLVMTWFATSNPQAFAPQNFPIFIRQTNNYDFSGFPTIEGCTLKVALNTGYGKVKDPDELDLRVPPEDLSKIKGAVHRFLPDLIPEPLRVNAYMDAYTSDGHSVVDKAPGLPNTVLLCGFSGHGFKMAPVMGQIAADLILDGKTSFSISHLSANRLTPV